MGVEWYTPSGVIEAARRTMGSIDLDPASCFTANLTVKATTYYTKEDSGLLKEWRGNVWLNPPFSGGFLPCFVNKAINHFEAGEIKSACILFPLTGRAAWHKRLFSSIHGLCHVADCTFGGVCKQNKWLIAVAYMGKYKTLFLEEFKDIGPTFLP